MSLLCQHCKIPFGDWHGNAAHYDKKPYWNLLMDRDETFDLIGRHYTRRQHGPHIVVVGVNGGYCSTQCLKTAGDKVHPTYQRLEDEAVERERKRKEEERKQMIRFRWNYIVPYI